MLFGDGKSCLCALLESGGECWTGPVAAVTAADRREALIEISIMHGTTINHSRFNRQRKHHFAIFIVFFSLW